MANQSTGSSDTEDITSNTTEPPLTPSSPHSGYTSPNGEATATQKKKKKKKPKKKAKETTKPKDDGEGKPPVLCISRNKHWKYISSYHGPWLQLPLELLESLLVLNLDPATLSGSGGGGSETKFTSVQIHTTTPALPAPKQPRGFASLSEITPPDSPRLSNTVTTTTTTLPLPPPLPIPKPGKATPPPIDPGVFRSVTSIRRLIDEAAELSVRATSGLSAAELGTMRGATSGSGGGSASILGSSPWAAAQTLGINPLGNVGGSGRNVAMSAMRIHRLRALAVQKLAQAYKQDEIASSVMVMQGGSVFDDVAEKVLKVDPNDADAKYVHFFHEKIPSRQLAESTTTQLLDELIKAHPQRLEFYRTRGIVHCFRDEYQQATKDFTHALKEARAARKAKLAHNERSTGGTESSSKSSKKKKGKTNGQAPPSGTSTTASETTVDGPDGEPLLVHPSVLPDAPEPIEPQLLFLRGATFLQQAIHLIESTCLKLENVQKSSNTIDGAELKLCYLEHGKYGGTEIGNSDGPLGSKEGVKLQGYRRVLGDEKMKEQVYGLLKKSMRDHEKFLSHFDTLDSSPPVPDGDIAQQTEKAFIISEAIRPGNHPSSSSGSSNGGVNLNDPPTMFTTYHPLLVESYFSILICQLMQGDFIGLLPAFIKTGSLVDGLEGYPVFLPPRSMAQAEFVEVLERLVGGWKLGVLPHSFSRERAKGRFMAIEPVPVEKVVSSDAASSSSSSSSTLASSSRTSTPQPPPPNSIPTRPDATESLDALRILLSPVLNRQKERAEKAAADKAAGIKKKSLSINIPLHGARVDIILAWLGAVHLPEL